MIRANKPISATQAEHFSRITSHTERHYAVKSGFFDLRWSDPYFIEYGKLRPCRAVQTAEPAYEIKPIIYEFSKNYEEMKKEFMLFLEVSKIPFAEMESRRNEISGEWILRVKVVPTTYCESVKVAQWIQFHAIIAAQ